MKGKRIFTQIEIQKLKDLINQRNRSDPSRQKGIRQKMRDIGFYGMDDWGIRDLQLVDLDRLIVSGRIQVIGGASSIRENSPVPDTFDSSKVIPKKVFRNDSDESYVMDLCDEVLGMTSSRQHRFDFLLGDPGKTGQQAKLPVDAYYERINLVIEFNELQHTEEVLFYDKPHKLTVSGVHRGEQRRIYEQRRREVLPKHGTRIVFISYTDFQFNSRKRIIRNRVKDREIVHSTLRDFQ